jgi:hypothetical protein
MMNKKKIFKHFAIGAGVLSLLAVVLLVGNINNAGATLTESAIEKEGKAFELEVEKSVSDLAIKTFDIDTNKYKPLFSSDLEKESTSVTEDIKTKVTAAGVMLSMDKILKIGDKFPVYFFGENEVLIAIEHGDKTMSLLKYDVSGDVSKQKPVQTDHIVKEVK